MPQAATISNLWKRWGQGVENAPNGAFRRPWYAPIGAGCLLHRHFAVADQAEAREEGAKNRHEDVRVKA